eukprot:Colp12_sorted_trinity150504_noHs@19589
MPKDVAPSKKAKKEKVVKAKRAKKDPNKPKRKLPPYMFFCKENREKIKAENPDATFGQIGKLLGEKWASMTEKDKQPYVKKAEEDKKRYEKEIEKYTSNKGAAHDDDDEDEDEDDDE